MDYNTENEKLSREAGAASSGPAGQGEQARPSYWAVLPAAIRYDAEIPASAKLLYAEISALTDQRGYCWASNAYFEGLYGLSERTIVRLIRVLEKAGYIRILEAGGGATRRKIAAGINPLGSTATPQSALSADSSPDQGSQEGCTGDDGEGLTPDKNVSTPRQKCQGGGDKNVTQNKKENRKENDPPKAPQGAEEAPKKKKRQVKAKATCEYEPELFERFWNLYPRGEAKAEARYEWDELRPDLELMRTMSAVLKRQIVSDEWRRDGGRAIPYACRWLSHRRWEDEKLDAARRAAEGEQSSEASRASRASSGPYRQGGQGGGQDGPAPSERRDVLWI